MKEKPEEHAPGAASAPALLATETARLWCARAQGLLSSRDDVGSIVTDTGFLRTLGGSDVYLALRARCEKPLRRATVDRLVATGQLRVVPAVRGCIYLVSGEQAPWALRIADVLSASRRRREYAKVDLSEREIETLAGEVLRLLEEQPLTTDALRRRLPAGTIRSFGEVGKKIGLSSSLPPVLRELEFRGSIQRTLEGGQLDSEKYHWAVAEPAHALPLTSPEDLVWWLAQRLLEWVGVVRLEAMVSWSGFGKRLCAKALERLVEEGLARAMHIADGVQESSPCCTPIDLDPAADLAQSSRFSFLPFEDNLVQLQGGAAPLVPARHADHLIPRWGQSKKMVRLGEAQHLGLRAIVRSGVLVGFWEVDLAAGGAVTNTLDALRGAERQALDEAADAAARFLLDEIGNPFWFSIDRESSIERRADLVRSLRF